MLARLRIVFFAFVCPPELCRRAHKKYISLFSAIIDESISQFEAIEQKYLTMNLVHESGTAPRHIEIGAKRAFECIGWERARARYVLKLMCVSACVCVQKNRTHEKRGCLVVAGSSPSFSSFFPQIFRLQKNDFFFRRSCVMCSLMRNSRRPMNKKKKKKNKRFQAKLWLVWIGRKGRMRKKCALKSEWSKEIKRGSQCVCACVCVQMNGQRMAAMVRRRNR